jgi:hypothetical protein
MLFPLALRRGMVTIFRKHLPMIDVRIPRAGPFYQWR